MKTKIAVLACTLLALNIASYADQTKTDVVERLQTSATVLRNIELAPDKGIPDAVIKSAKCVAVVPSMLKGAFIFGGKHGRGVATCRLPHGSWSAPAFFAISGGSWGAQVGFEHVQLVMMIMTDQGMRHLMANKLQIAGTISAAVGPVGRDASAGADWKLDTDMLTYSRSKGLFAGIDLSGSWIERDKDSTRAMYGKDYFSTQIFTGKVPPPSAARAFLTEVRDSVQHSGNADVASVSSARRRP